MLSTAGRGLDGTWVDEDIAAIVMTPLSSIVVVQYLAQLMRRLDQQREQAQRSLHETSALYKVAQTVATADPPETLVEHVVETLEGLARFDGLAVFSLREGGTPVAGGGLRRRRRDRTAPLGRPVARRSRQPDGVVG